MNEDLTLIDYQVQADWLNIFWQQLEDKKIKQRVPPQKVSQLKLYLSYAQNYKAVSGLKAS